MKPVQCTKPDGTPMLGQPRQMAFGSGDVRRLIRQFNAPLLGSTDDTVADSLIGRLYGQDVNVIAAMLLTGLGNYNRKLDVDDIDKIIDAHLDDGGTYSDLVRLIRLALEEGNHIPKQKEQPTGAGAESRGRDLSAFTGGEGNPT